MKKNARNTPGPGAWFLGGVTSLLMCMSALGQFTATQNSPIPLNDPINVGSPAAASPYPSSIYLTNANILGVVERVEVSVNGITHPNAPDVALLLVGPNNKS